MGGRTSAVVPSIQKKTGPVAKEMDEAVIKDGGSEEEKPKKGAGKKCKVEEEDEEEGGGEAREEANGKKGKKQDKHVANGEEAKVNGTTPKKVERWVVPVKAEEKLTEEEATIRATVERVKGTNARSLYPREGLMFTIGLDDG